MACPDAMYFTINYYSKRTHKKVWTPLAKKWELNRMLLLQGVKHFFSCQALKCYNFAQSVFTSLLLSGDVRRGLVFFLQRFI